jgi:hypothetical protein
VAGNNNQDARRKAATIAAAVLGGRVSAVLGAIDLNKLRASVGVPDDDPDFRTFLVIDSECDALPFGTVRQHWSAEALATKEPEIAQAEQWAMETGKQAFTNIVTRFAPTV